MKVYKTSAGIAIENNGQVYVSAETNWDTFINRSGLYAAIQAEISGLTAVGNQEWLSSVTIHAPIQNQEIWASGVTYLRSRNARMEESKEAGGDTFYDKVYEAERPELFFKATAARTQGPDQLVRIRKDSSWDVPEPELTLCINSQGEIVGYTVGNDMSSRSIEGENPLYLPQAKSYTRSAAIGPCVLVLDAPISPDTTITLEINRASNQEFNASIAINQIKRPLTELVHYLFRECEFPYGAFLMTGTGIVPDHPFTLQSGDEILISISGIGTLRNIVE
jgi:2-dehydro-3-deoxy-D-arabinonate dehydratase